MQPPSTRTTSASTVPTPVAPTPPWRPSFKLDWLYTDDKRPIEDDEEDTDVILSGGVKAILSLNQQPPRWMVSPTRLWRIQWELFMQFLIVFQAVAVPYEVAFVEEYLMMTHVGWLILEILIMLLFLADMILTFRTGVLVHGKVLYDRYRVARHYITTWFPLDLIAWIPSVLAIVLLPFDTEAEDSRSTAVTRLGRSIRFARVVRVLRVLQIARIARLRNAVRGLKVSLLHSQQVAKVVEQVGIGLGAFLLLHLVACLWGAVAPLNDHLVQQGMGTDASETSKYILALWWASCALTFGGQPHPWSDAERLLTVFVNLVSVAVICTALARFVPTFSSPDGSRNEIKDKLRIASRYAEQHGLPKQLTLEVKQAIQHASYSQESAREFKQLIEEDLSQDLCQRVYGWVHGNLLRRFPPFSEEASSLFQGCSVVPDRFLSQLAYEARITTFMQGDRVATAGEKAETMVFVLEGSLLLLAPKLPQPVVLQEKYWFGEPVLIFDYVRGNEIGNFRWTTSNSTRSASIVALENCKLLEIGQDSFKDAVKQHGLLHTWLLPVINHVESKQGTLGCSCCRQLTHWVTMCPQSTRSPLERLHIARSMAKSALSAEGCPPRPRWLPMTGPGNMNVPPEMWGMTLRQWSAFIMACCFTDKWGELEESTDRKKAGHVNLYQVCDHMVKPWTKGTGNSVALLMNNTRPLKADVMVSHAWGESILETLMAVLGKASVTGITLDTTIWFCTFAQYQPGNLDGDCGPTVEQQLAMDPFKRVIESRPRHGMLVVHTSTAELYGRLWCVFEVNEARDADVRAISAYSMGALKMLQDLGTTDAELEAALRVDTSGASCWSESDASMIRGKIQSGCGFEELNEKILDFRLASVGAFRAMFEKFVDWAGSGSQEKATFEGLTKVVQLAGVFIGLHCLAPFVEETQDSDLAVKLMAKAKEILKLWSSTFVSNAVPPPCLDASKVRIRMDLDDDAEIKACMLDLGHFPFAMGLLEMAAGGNLPALLAQEVGLNDVDNPDRLETPKVQQSFHQWTGGACMMQRSDLQRVISTLGLEHLEPDLDLQFSLADANSDGLIDFLEFKAWLRAAVQ